MLKKILISASIFTITIHCVNAMDMLQRAGEGSVIIRDQFKNFSLLPEELQEGILKEMMTSRDVGFISSFPAVCKEWNFFINSPVTTKWLLKQPLRGLYEERHKIFPVRQLQTAGAKQYRCIGEQIIDCSKEGDIEGIKKLLENPYANIDYVTRIKFNKHYFQTPLVIACLKGNPELYPARA